VREVRGKGPCQLPPAGHRPAPVQPVPPKGYARGQEAQAPEINHASETDPRLGIQALLLYNLIQNTDSGLATQANRISWSGLCIAPVAQSWLREGEVDEEWLNPLSRENGVDRFQKERHAHRHMSFEEQRFL